MAALTKTLPPVKQTMRRMQSIGSMIRLSVVVLAGLIGLIAGAAHAQSVETAVAAKVNDEIITTFDVEQRYRLLVGSAGIDADEATREALRRQILDTLINETLQIQEALEQEIEVTDEELRSALANLAARNETSLSAMSRQLGEMGTGLQTLQRQIYAQLLWGKLVRRNFSDRLSVDEVSVNAEMARMKDAITKTRYRIREIFLDVPARAERPDVERRARAIVSELRSGTAFAQMAQQVSDLPSAARGGDLGWQTLDAMPDAVADVVADELPVGAVSDPIPTADGFYIIAIADVANPAELQGIDAIVRIRQLLARPQQRTDAEGVERARAAVTRAAESADGCADLETAATASNGRVIAADLGEVRLSQLRDSFRQALAGVEDGEASRPVLSRSGVHILFVCDRREIEGTRPQVREPSFREVAARMEDQRLQTLGQQYLSDLRRNANIQIRRAGG